MAAPTRFTRRRATVPGERRAFAQPDATYCAAAACVGRGDGVNDLPQTLSPACTLSCLQPDAYTRPLHRRYAPNLLAADDVTLERLINDDEWRERATIGWLPPAYLCLNASAPDVTAEGEIKGPGIGLGTGPRTPCTTANAVLVHDRGLLPNGHGHHSEVVPVVPPRSDGSGGRGAFPMGVRVQRSYYTAASTERQRASFGPGPTRASGMLAPASGAAGRRTLVAVRGRSTLSQKPMLRSHTGSSAAFVGLSCVCVYVCVCAVYLYVRP